MFQIKYDSTNKPIEISFIKNNYIDDQIKCCPICCEHTRLIIDDKKFILFQHSNLLYCYHTREILRNNNILSEYQIDNELCSIIRKENNDITVEKKLVFGRNRLLNISLGNCSCGYTEDCDSEIPLKIISNYTINNQIILGTYANIYIYDLQNFEEKGKMSFNHKQKEIKSYFFIANQQKNEIYCIFQFNESKIKIYLISIKYMELATTFNFEDDFKLKIYPNKYYLLTNAYYLEYYQIFILSFGKNLLLIYKYDNNNDISFIKRIDLTQKRNILDIKLIDKINVITFETTKEDILNKKEKFHYKKIDNFGKFIENPKYFNEYLYNKYIDYEKSELSEEEEEESEKVDMEDYFIGNIDMKNNKDSKGKKSKKYKSKQNYKKK
jgi:hypothetical protein